MTIATNNIASHADSAKAKGQFGHLKSLGADAESHDGHSATASALKFITCGSVDDGKSTLIGRLLVDSRSVLLDQLASVSKSGEADLALFTDGLSAEREQGITIDVAYRYFATPTRKFIIGDAPGHEQYTRNMVTAASSAHAAVVLVDATKLKWNVDGLVDLLPQTRRHSLLVNLLRVPSIIFAVNKLDALGDDAAKAFAKITEALQAFAAQAGIAVTATIPMSALKGHNVVTANPGWCGYNGPSLLSLLETLPVTDFAATGWLLIGSIPGVLIGSQFSVRAGDRFLRISLALVLFLSGVKLIDFPGAILVISHDREFLNQLVGSIVEIAHAKLIRYRGNWDNYLEQKAARAEQQLAAYKNQQKEIAALQEFVSRFRSVTSKASQAMSKLKQIERMELIEKPLAPRKPFRFQIPPPPRGGPPLVP